MAAPLLYREHDGCPALAPWVDAFWTIRCSPEAPAGLRHWAMPEGCAGLVFWYRGAAARGERLFPPILSGPTLRPLNKPALAGESYLGVRFRPGAASAFLDLNPGEIAERVLPLSHVQPRWAERLQARLAEADCLADALALLEAELLERLPARAEFDRAASAAAQELRRTRGSVGVDELAAAVGLSGRQFRRRFQAAVGLSPKSFAAIARAQAALRRRLQAPSLGWAALAQWAGYADQAHLCRELRRLSGAMPTEFQSHLDRIDHAGLRPLGEAPTGAMADSFKTAPNGRL